MYPTTVRALFLLSLLALSTPVFPQEQSLLQAQTDTWNSTFALTSDQILAANISQATADAFNIGIQFERTNWATGSVRSDPFYAALPHNASSAAPGSLLKVEAFVNTTTYTLAPALALSRIVYQSADSNGTAVPASAYILWPFSPRSHGPQQRIPLVAFAHGVSGIFAECAPSHIRNLWYQYSAPYTLALHGYAVVSPDFAGLGVPRYADGRPIDHHLFDSPAGANDLVYAVQAAQSAFSELSHDFLVMGHSQGGGIAWAAAQRQAVTPVQGYLGTIAASPTTNETRQVAVKMAPIEFWVAAKGIVDSFRDGPRLTDIITAQGQRLLDLLEQAQGCGSALANLVTGLTEEAASDGGLSRLAVFNESFLSSYWLASWQNKTVAGGKEVAGPLLVLQGIDDMSVPEVVTTESVNKTCEAYPRSQLEYVRVEGVTHVPVLFATQTRWLNWIADRFAGTNVTASPCERRTVRAPNAPRPLEAYSRELNYYLELATSPYQVA